MKKLLLSLAAFLFLSTASYGQIELILNGNNTFATPRIIFNAANQTSSMNWSLGGGGLLSFAIGTGGKRAISLELGAQYYPLAFTSSFSGTSTMYTFPFIRFPLQVMVGLNKYIFAGVGFYVATLMGNISTTTTAGTTTTTVSNTPSSLGYGTIDYGFNAMLGLQFPIGPKANLYIRGQYGIGIANLDVRNGNLLQSFDLGAMAGLSFVLK